MTEYVWTDLRNHAVTSFEHETPSAETENRIIEIFRRAPALVHAEITRVAEDKRAGRVRSGWAVLRSRLDAWDEVAQRDIRATDATERTRAIANAEQWIRTAGIHHDRESELLDDLFGDFGGLRHHDTPELRKRMADLWRQHRPLGEQIEADQEMRLAEWHRWNAEQVDRRKAAIAQIAAEVEAKRTPPENDDLHF